MKSINYKRMNLVELIVFPIIAVLLFVNVDYVWIKNIITFVVIVTEIVICIVMHKLCMDNTKANEYYSVYIMTIIYAYISAIIIGDIFIWRHIFFLSSFYFLIFIIGLLTYLFAKNYKTKNQNKPMRILLILFISGGLSYAKLILYNLSPDLRQTFTFICAAILSFILMFFVGLGFPIFIRYLKNNK